MWVIGSGAVDGGVFEVEFEITDGGVYGTNFDPDTVNHYPWGTGKFSFSSCYAGKAEIIPNEIYSAEFEDLTIFISRLTQPDICGDE